MANNVLTGILYHYTNKKWLVLNNEWRFQHDLCFEDYSDSLRKGMKVEYELVDLSNPTSSVKIVKFID